MHRIWQLAAEYLGWQGGTIHQIARECGIAAFDVSSLLMNPGDRCAVKITGLNGAKTFIEADFVSYDAIYHTAPDSAAPRWISCTAYAPGFNNSGLLTGLSAGHSLLHPRYLQRAA